MNLRKILNMAATATVLCVVSAVSQAGFVRTGDIILDERTGFEWLRVDAPRDHSLITLQTELTFGGQFEGYRIAERAEVEDLLFNSAGYDPGLSDIANYPVVREFIDKFEFLISEGIYGETNLGARFRDGAGVGLLEAKYIIYPGVSNIGSAQIYSNITTDFPEPLVGWFLRKESSAVPVSSTSLIFIMIGLAGLCAMRVLRLSKQ